MDLIPASLINNTRECYLFKVTSKSKVIYWIIISMIVFGLAILPFIYVDVSVIARGLFQSEIEKQTIFAPYQGKVIFTAVKNGNKVLKGDTLFIIDSESTKALLNALQQKILENNSVISDLELLIKIEKQKGQLLESDFKNGRYFIEYSNLEKLQIIQSQKYQKAKAEYERNSMLHKHDIIPDSEFENSLFTYRAEEANLNQIFTYQLNIWQIDLMQRKSEAISLKAEFDKYSEDLNNRVVLAPVSGEIIQSSDIQEGSIIGLNQVIAEISPNGQLLATCFVSPNDIGLIHYDQLVRIQVDALNYNDWGLINGSITEISDDIIIEGGSTAYFRVKCRPDKTILTLKNGTIAELKKGMSMNARIVVIRRSLFNLLFDKIDDWINPYLSEKAHYKNEY